MAQFDLDRFGNVMSRLLVIRQRNISVIFNTFLIIFLAFAMFVIPMFSGKTIDDIGYRQLVIDIVGPLRSFSPFVFFVLGTFFIQDLEGCSDLSISYLCIFYCCRRITAVDFNDYCTRRKDVYGCSLL